MVTADDVFVEPAENVVLGELTDNIPNALPTPPTLKVQGVELVFLTDPRIPFGTAVNGAGFEVDPFTAPVGGLVGVEGYFGTDGKLYIFAFECDGCAVVGPTFQVSITRAQCTANGRLEVRGATTNPAADGQITISDVSGAPVALGTVAVGAFDPVEGVALFRFRENTRNLPNGGVCPTRVRATHNSDGSFAEANL